MSLEYNQTGEREGGSVMDDGDGCFLVSIDTLAGRERQHEATRLRASRVANIDVCSIEEEISIYNYYLNDNM